MAHGIKKIFEYIFRGYGQLFLCPNVISGLLFFLGGLIYSPKSGILGLLGAFTVTAFAAAYPKKLTYLKTGLFGVNAVLLGYLWIILPEIPDLIKLTATLLGSIIIAIIIIPNYIQNRDHSISLFSIPFMLLAWSIFISFTAMGLYDRKELLGWHFLFRNKPVLAEKNFDSVNVSSKRALAYKFDGLGWSSFKQGKYTRARAHFEKAIGYFPKFGDPYDGLGWCLFQEGKYADAEHAFSNALSLNKFLADSWDGLGWINLRNKKTKEAKACFLKAVLISPLFTNAYNGLHECAVYAGGNDAAKIYFSLYYLTDKYIAFPYKFITIPQIIMCVLFLAGIFVHSRVSGALVFFGLAVSMPIVYMINVFLGWSFEINCIYNALAITIALGGHYLVINHMVFPWIIFILTANAFFWGAFYEKLLWLGLPLLVLPFNMFLIGSLLLFSTLKKYKFSIQVIPLDIAITTPTKVRLWYRKKKIAEKCWKMVREYPMSASSS